ncbi:MAG: T9SS type A sorting domain-containing protein, partial [Bacteroidota bacterium]|nr:T9SS type A sorting domain-containing protein [Bacteroidota bacterium]
YDVFMLGSMYMDSVDNSITTSCIIRNLSNTTNTYWFSVRAKGPQQAIGRRAIAIEKLPGVFCPGAVDASVVAISSPQDYYVSCMNTSALPVIVQLRNPGLTTITNIPVSFSVNGGTPVNEMYVGSIAPSAIVTYTFTATAAITITGNNTVEVWAAYPNDIDGTNDTAVISVVYALSTAVIPPLSEDFESFTLCSSASDCESTNCAMINGFRNLVNGTEDDIDWRTFEGATPTTVSGPGMDYNPGTATGNYLYLEASGGCAFKTALLFTPCIDLTSFTNPTLTFAYHMYGSTMGEMHVDVYSGGTWINDLFTMSGDQGNLWRIATVPLSAYSGQVIIIRFRGITGSSTTSDMAIDAVNIGNLNSVNETASGVSVNVFPNPGDGLFNLSVSQVNNESVIATIYDVAGRKIMETSYGEVSGILSEQIDLSAFENGTYILEIRIGAEREIIRLNKME